MNIFIVNCYFHHFQTYICCECQMSSTILQSDVIFDNTIVCIIGITTPKQYHQNQNGRNGNLSFLKHISYVIYDGLGKFTADSLLKLKTILIFCLIHECFTIPFIIFFLKISKCHTVYIIILQYFHIQSL